MTREDGRYHEATPNWLCIHKRWLVEPSNYASGKPTQKHNPGKPITVRRESGEVLAFTDKVTLSKHLQVEVSIIYGWFYRAKKHHEKKALMCGEMYQIVDENK